MNISRLWRLSGRLFYCLGFLALGAPAHATGSPPVSVCDPYTNAAPCIKPNSDGSINVDGTFSATLGGFAPASIGTPITATTSGVTGALPGGAVVVATNVDPTNGVYCQLGATGSTNGSYLSPGGGWFGFTVGVNTQITCTAAASTVKVTLVGGSGLPTGTGGGGGGGGGGTVTQGTAASSGPWIVQPWQGGAVQSVTNGGFTNLLQANAVLSATNGLFTNIVTAGAAVGPTNGLPVNLLVGNAANSATNPVHDDIRQWAGGTVGAPVTYDTTPTGLAPGVNAAVSGYTSQHLGAPLTASTTTSTSTAITAGTYAVAQNVGTNGAYCLAGSGPATVSAQYIGPNGGEYAWYQSGGITQIACITSSGSTTMNWTTGDGLPSLAGGGGSSGGAIGNITQWNSVALGSPTAWGTPASGNVIGANVDIVAGGIAGSAAGTDPGGSNFASTQGNIAGIVYPSNAKAFIGTYVGATASARTANTAIGCTSTSSPTGTCTNGYWVIPNFNRSSGTTVWVSNFSAILLTGTAGSYVGYLFPSLPTTNCTDNALYNWTSSSSDVSLKPLIIQFTPASPNVNPSTTPQVIEAPVGKPFTPAATSAYLCVVQTSTAAITQEVFELDVAWQN